MACHEILFALKIIAVLKLDRVYALCPQFLATYKLDTLKQRGGWKLIIESLEKDSFFDTKSQTSLIDSIENYFLIRIVQWLLAGVIHSTPFTPQVLDSCSLIKCTIQ